MFDVYPERLTIWTTDAGVVGDRVDPRASYPAFDLGTTKWDQIQFAYLASTANWNYMTQPYSFTYPGVDVHEIEPWHEGGQTWRRLAVRFPESNANHNPDQVFYYDANFMPRRMDYSPDITGNSLIAVLRARSEDVRRVRLSDPPARPHARRRRQRRPKSRGHRRRRERPHRLNLYR